MVKNFSQLDKFQFWRRMNMKKIMFGNSLMLLGLAIYVITQLCVFPVHNAYYPSLIILLIGFVLAVVGFFSEEN